MMNIYMILQEDAFRVGCRRIRVNPATVTDASFLPSCTRCEKHRHPSRMDGSICSFCRRRANWVVERKDAKRSLNGIFAISTIYADHDDTDDAVDLDTYLLRRRRNIESALRHALENQK